MSKRRDSKGRILKQGEYEQKDGRYRYSWTDKTGKRHYVYATNLKELRKKEIEITKDTIDGIRVERNSLTLNDLYCKWKNVKRGLRQNTFSNYCYMYEKYVYQSFGNTKIIDIRKSDIRAFYNQLFEKSGLSISTIDTIQTVVHQVLEIAVEDDYLRGNPSDSALKELKRVVPKNKRNALTPQEREMFLNYLKVSKDKKWYPVFIILMFTGMRSSEAMGLRWRDIDFANSTINVNHIVKYYSTGRGEPCIFKMDKPKTEKSVRIIPMLPIVKNAFLTIYNEQRKSGIKCNQTIDDCNDFVFINRFGNVQLGRNLNRALKRIIENFNNTHPDAIPDFSCHVLRHTFATFLNENNINLKVREDVLGHSDISTTMDIYTDVSSEQVMSEFSKLA